MAFWIVDIQLKIFNAYSQKSLGRLTFLLINPRSRSPSLLDLNLQARMCVYHASAKANAKPDDVVALKKRSSVLFTVIKMIKTAVILQHLENAHIMPYVPNVNGQILPEIPFSLHIFKRYVSFIEFSSYS